MSTLGRWFAFPCARCPCKQLKVVPRFNLSWLCSDMLCSFESTVRCLQLWSTVLWCVIPYRPLSSGTSPHEANRMAHCPMSMP